MALATIIYIISFLSNVHLIEGRNDIFEENNIKRASFKRIFEDCILDVVSLATFSSVSLLTCTHKCLSNDQCLSFNININMKICKLLSVDRNDETTADFFVSKKQWNYYEIGRYSDSGMNDDAVSR